MANLKQKTYGEIQKEKELLMLKAQEAQSLQKMRMRFKGRKISAKPTSKSTTPAGNKKKLLIPAATGKKL